MPSENGPHETRRDRGDRAEVLVRMREDGDKPPLYFMPAGYGDIRAFRSVAALLDDDQPVYGLQPPGTELMAGLRNEPVPWLVSLYIAEIKRVQPEGPYRLAGYCSGGLPMVETARELIRSGDAVDLAIALDPPLTVPTWLVLFYMSLSKLCNLTNLTDTIRWNVIGRWNSPLLRWLSDEGLCTHMRIFRAHKVTPYPGRIIYIRPRDSWIRWLNRTCIGNSWLRIARDGLETHWMSGGHYGMLRGEQVEVLAGALHDCLKRRPLRNVM